MPTHRVGSAMLPIPNLSSLALSLFGRPSDDSGGSSDSKPSPPPAPSRPPGHLDPPHALLDSSAYQRLLAAALSGPSPLEQGCRLIAHAPFVHGLEDNPSALRYMFSVRDNLLHLLIFGCYPQVIAGATGSWPSSSDEPRGQARPGDTDTAERHPSLCVLNPQSYPLLRAGPAETSPQIPAPSMAGSSSTPTLPRPSDALWGCARLAELGWAPAASECYCRFLYAVCLRSQVEPLLAPTVAKVAALAQELNLPSSSPFSPPEFTGKVLTCLDDLVVGASQVQQVLSKLLWHHRHLRPRSSSLLPDTLGAATGGGPASPPGDPAALAWAGLLPRLCQYLQALTHSSWSALLVQFERHARLRELAEIVQDRLRSGRPQVSPTPASRPPVLLWLDEDQPSRLPNLDRLLHSLSLVCDLLWMTEAEIQAHTPSLHPQPYLVPLWQQAPLPLSPGAAVATERPVSHRLHFQGVPDLFLDRPPRISPDLRAYGYWWNVPTGLLATAMGPTGRPFFPAQTGQSNGSDRASCSPTLLSAPQDVGSTASRTASSRATSPCPIALALPIWLRPPSRAAFDLSPWLSTARPTAEPSAEHHQPPADSALARLHTPSPLQTTLETWYLYLSNIEQGYLDLSFSTALVLSEETSGEVLASSRPRTVVVGAGRSGPGPSRPSVLPSATAAARGQRTSLAGPPASESRSARPAAELGSGPGPGADSDAPAWSPAHLAEDLASIMERILTRYFSRPVALAMGSQHRGPRPPPQFVVHLFVLLDRLREVLETCVFVDLHRRIASAFPRRASTSWQPLTVVMSAVSGTPSPALSSSSRPAPSAASLAAAATEAGSFLGTLAGGLVGTVLTQVYGPGKGPGATSTALPSRPPAKSSGRAHPKLDLSSRPSLSVGGALEDSRGGVTPQDDVLAASSTLPLELAEPAARALNSCRGVAETLRGLLERLRAQVGRVFASPDAKRIGPLIHHLEAVLETQGVTMVRRILRQCARTSVRSDAAPALARALAGSSFLLEEADYTTLTGGGGPLPAAIEGALTRTLGTPAVQILTPLNQMTLCLALITELMPVVEQQLLRFRFNQLGGLWLDHQVRILEPLVVKRLQRLVASRQVSGVGGGPETHDSRGGGEGWSAACVRSALVRLDQVTMLLSVGTGEDIFPLIKHIGATYSLDVHETVAVLSCRIDLVLPPKAALASLIHHS